jgi:hypothetical protein
MFSLIKIVLSNITTNANNIPDKNLLLPEPQLAFLSEFIQPKDINKISNSWASALGEPAKLICEKFIQTGLLTHPPIESLLDACLSVAKLKKFSKTPVRIGIIFVGMSANIGNERTPPG